MFNSTKIERKRERERINVRIHIITHRHAISLVIKEYIKYIMKIKNS